MQMLFIGRTLRAAVAGACLALGLGSAVAAPQADFGRHAASEDARYAAQWVLDAADNEGKPFAIVDKKAAQMFVFTPSGHVIGSTPALLGLAPGDASAPGVGQLAQGYLPAALRTTPAGRFASEPGRNRKGEDIVWVDYDAAFAIHRLRPGADQARRAQQLATPTPADNRASLGCVVVPVAFYDGIVKPTLGKAPAVVYVLPETRPVQATFGTLQMGLAAAH
jgi:hypothetical protein